MKLAFYFVVIALFGWLCVWYFFFALPKTIDQSVNDINSWRHKPDTLITVKNGHYDTTITIKK